MQTRPLILAWTTALALAAPAAAQPAPAAWHTVVEAPDRTRLAVDSVSLRRTSDSTWFVLSATTFPAPLQVEDVNADREIDKEELDCSHGRSSGIEAALYLGVDRVMVRPLPTAWAGVPENRRPALDAICAYAVAANLPAPRRTFALAEVEQEPRLINVTMVAHALSQAYPVLLRDAGISGTVTIAFAITEDGRVDRQSVRIVSSSQLEFETAALNVVNLMRFFPAKVNGRPVRVWARIPVTFQLSGWTPGISH